MCLNAVSSAVSTRSSWPSASQMRIAPSSEAVATASSEGDQSAATMGPHCPPVRMLGPLAAKIRRRIEMLWSRL